MGGVTVGIVLGVNVIDAVVAVVVVSSPEHDMSNSSGKSFPSAQFSHT